RTALIPTWWLRALTPAGDGSPTRTSGPSDSRKSPFLVPTGKSAAVGEDGDGCRRCRSKEPEVRDGKARRETTEVPGREPVRRHGDNIARGRLAAFDDRLGGRRRRQGLVQHGPRPSEDGAPRQGSACLTARRRPEQHVQVGRRQRA